MISGEFTLLLTGNFENSLRTIFIDPMGTLIPTNLIDAIKLVYSSMHGNILSTILNNNIFYSGTATNEK